VRRLLAIAIVVPISPNLVTLMMEAIRFTEMLVLKRTTCHNIPEEGILQSVRLLLDVELGWAIFH
jgi:hypothetical protein